MAWGCLSLADADPSLTLDLQSPPPTARITRIHGHGNADDGLRGVPVSGGLDCDGDGFADFAFAQFLADPLDRIGAGEVTLIFGDGTIGYTAEASFLQPGILRIAGAQHGESAGAEAWIDDVTGDGIGEVIIGRQNYSLETAERPGAGALTILVGGSILRTQAESLSHWDLAAPPEGARQITFVGPSSYDRLGIWMRTGDITGDGTADILVGADEVDAAGAPLSQNQGAAFVIRGGPHLLEAPAIVDLGEMGQSSFPSPLRGHIARIDPPANADDYHFGGTVQVCDLDGNGPAEVIVAATIQRAGASVRLAGAPAGTGEGVGGAPNGAVFIIWNENFPPGLWPADYRFPADQPPEGSYTRIDGPEDAESFGEELLGGLDFSGDGFPELMVGDLVADPANRANAGRGYVFYNAGNLRDLDFSLDDPPVGVAFSTVDGPIAGAISSDTLLQGDFDGDGIGDVGIGNPHDTFLERADAGSIHVLYGQPGGWPEFIDLLPSALPPPSEMRIALIRGAQGTSGSDHGDTLCYSAASGDINGDGRPDLIVNEMAGNALAGTLEDVGNLLVIDATSLLPSPQPSLALMSTETIDFGVAEVESTVVTKTAVIRNTQSETLSINAISVVGPQASDFSISQDSGETTLAPGEDRILEILFAPSHGGRFGAALQVQTDTDPQAVRFGLRGKGVGGILQSPEIRVSSSENLLVFALTSRLGASYSLSESSELGGAFNESSDTVEGTGSTLYFTLPFESGSDSPVFFQARAQR